MATFVQFYSVFLDSPTFLPRSSAQVMNVLPLGKWAVKYKNILSLYLIITFASIYKKTYKIRK